MYPLFFFFFFFSSRRRHTRLQGDWSSDVCSSDLTKPVSQSRNGGTSTAAPGSGLRRTASPEGSGPQAASRGGMIAAANSAALHIQAVHAAAGAPARRESRLATVTSAVPFAVVTNPLGSGSGQSPRFAPGPTGHSSPHPIVIRTWTPLARVCGQLLRARVGEVDAELAHDRYDFAVNALAGRPP